MAVHVIVSGNCSYVLLSHYAYNASKFGNGFALEQVSIVLMLLRKLLNAELGFSLRAHLLLRVTAEHAEQ